MNIGFWIYMLAVDLLFPVIMIVFGRLFLKHIPQNINHVFGYRTKMSMKNRDTWAFAHMYCGRLWFYGGLIMLPASVIPLLCVLGRNIDVVSTVGTTVTIIEIVLMILTIIPTEVALRRTFDKYGRRR